MLSKIKNISWVRRILIFLMSILSVLNKIIPKKKNQILFYDSSKSYLDGNTEIFYTWLKSNGFDSKYKLLCCVTNKNISSTILNYKPIGACQGVWAYLRSKYVFFSYGDFRIKPARNQIVVNQWHGTPIKKIGKLTDDPVYRKESIDNFTYVIAPSKFFSTIFANAFGCNINKVLIQGSARNDYLFSKRNGLSCLSINRGLYKKIILWMPTFRESKDGRYHDVDTSKSETLLPLLDTYKDLDDLNRVLQEKALLLVIKVHPFADFKDTNLSNIRIVTNEDIISGGVKLYEFIKEFDALLTDYSSVYCDYLLLDRPIGFTLDDIEIYQSSRGFTVDNVLDFMPGHHIYNKKELITFIEDIAAGEDPYQSQREQLIPLFWEYTDGRNCERLAHTLGIKL